MLSKHLIAAGLAVFLLINTASAQTAEVTITLNEQFFDSLLDSIFEHGGPPEMPIAQQRHSERETSPMAFGFAPQAAPCDEAIRLLRENQSVRTAVRFRDGKIYAPLAFSGSYNPPLVGCVDFAGFAETNIDLEFDRQTQTLIGRVRVLNVSLNGTAGIGSSVLTKLVQSSIDKKANPLEIVKADKLSFTLPIQKSAIRIEATGIRTEVANNTLIIHIDYDFPK